MAFGASLAAEPNFDTFTKSARRRKRVFKYTRLPGGADSGPTSPLVRFYIKPPPHRTCCQTAGFGKMHAYDRLIAPNKKKLCNIPRVPNCICVDVALC